MARRFAIGPEDRQPRWLKGSMSTLAFFPWMSVAERVVVGNVVLTPYALPKTPDAADPIAKIISSFREPGGAPIRTATIISLENQSDGDLDEDQREVVFQHATAIAFCALADRPFFEHFGY